MMRLEDIAGAAGGWISPESARRTVTRAVVDSRAASEGSLFFALPGSRTDGHLYVDDVLERGASAVVSEGGRREGVVLVEDVGKALLDAAAWRRKGISSSVVAVTGSSGKTTTRRLLCAAVGASMTVYSTPGNLNNQIGLPLTLLNAPEEDPDAVVLEAGMNHSGELLLLGRVASPDFSMVTNVGRSHMEFFDSIDDVARAKAELLTSTRTGGVCVIPSREDILARAAAERGLVTKTFGEGGDAWPERVNGGFIVKPWDLELNLRLGGRHNVMNAVAALLMADVLGVPLPPAVRAMNDLCPAEGRGRIASAGNITIIDESYNANPDSTAACLDVLAACGGARGAVLGDMLELGEDAPLYHREVLRKADSMGLSFLVLTGSIYASVSDEVRLTEFRNARGWKEALDMLKEMAPAGSTVLVKGSNALGLGNLVRSIEEGA